MNTYEIVEKALNSLNNKAIGAITIPVNDYDSFEFENLRYEALHNGINPEIDSFLNPKDGLDFTNITFTRLKEGQVVLQIDDEVDAIKTQIIYHPKGWYVSREDYGVGMVQEGQKINVAFVADFDVAVELLNYFSNRYNYPHMKKEVLEVEV